MASKRGKRRRFVRIPVMGPGRKSRKNMTKLRRRGTRRHPV